MIFLFPSNIKSAIYNNYLATLIYGLVSMATGNGTQNNEEENDDNDDGGFGEANLAMSSSSAQTISNSTEPTGPRAVRQRHRGGPNSSSNQVAINETATAPTDQSLQHHIAEELQHQSEEEEESKT
jgi:hypothetical protein